MKLESLTIAPRNSYSPVGENNPYVAKLTVSYNDNSMVVALSQAMVERMLQLVGDEVAAAAQVQISDFIRQALTVSKTPMIEGAVL